MQSEISVGARIADSVFELARLGRLPPDLATLDRFADGANAAIDAMANALEGKADVTPTARDAYVRGVLLALGVIRVLEPGPRRSRFRATAERLLDLVEPFVPDADRAKRAWLPPEPPPPALAQA